MHQRSYIDHCLKSNDMEKLKGLTTLPAVDERSPPEEEIDENGQATDYEEHKSACQKHIGQFMWLATRTRPDISATLGKGRLNSNVVEKNIQTRVSYVVAVAPLMHVEITVPNP